MQTTPNTTTITALLNCSSNEAATQLLEQLQTLGLIIQPFFITSTETINEMVSQSIDIVLTAADTAASNIESLISQLKQAKKTWPVIMLLEEYDNVLVQRGLIAGAQNVMTTQDAKLLAIAIKKEIDLVKAKRMILHLNQKLQATNDSGKTPEQEKSQQPSAVKSKPITNISSTKYNEEYLQKAISKDQLKIFFQPIVRIENHDKEIYEALLRISDENGNEISRETLFNMVAKANFSEKLDRWIIMQAIKHLSAYHESHPHTCLFIYISPASLESHDFCPWLQQLLNNARIQPAALTLQINENDAAQHLEKATHFIQQIKKFGCHAAIAQFKGAETSMNLLHHLAVNAVKLEGRWTHTLLDSEQNRKNLYGLVKQLHEKNIQVIASYIEGARVLAPLWQAQVDYLQGYYFQAPQPEMNYQFNH